MDPLPPISRIFPAATPAVPVRRVGAQDRDAPDQERRRRRRQPGAPDPAENAGYGSGGPSDEDPPHVIDVIA